MTQSSTKLYRCSLLLLIMLVCASLYVIKGFLPFMPTTGHNWNSITIIPKTGHNWSGGTNMHNSPSTGCAGYGRNSGYDHDNCCIKRLPNCLIIGAMKAGTTALLYFLNKHPQIVRNETYGELHFFTRYYTRGLEWYRSQMPYSFYGQIVIEKTPQYFTTPEVPKRVFQMNPDIRLILTVRNPVERAISEYAMDKAMHAKKQTGKPFVAFETSMKKYLRMEYDKSFENWLKYFKLKQIHVVDGQGFAKTPAQELRKIEDFLNIDHYFEETKFYWNSSRGFNCFKEPIWKGKSTETSMCLPEGKGRKHPNVNLTVMKQMKDYFRPHNARFYNLTGKYFDWDI